MLVSIGDCNRCGIDRNRIDDRWNDVGWSRSILCHSSDDDRNSIAIEDITVDVAPDITLETVGIEHLPDARLAIGWRRTVGFVSPPPVIGRLRESAYLGLLGSGRTRQLGGRSRCRDIVINKSIKYERLGTATATRSCVAIVPCRRRYCTCDPNADEDECCSNPNREQAVVVVFVVAPF